MKDPEEESQIIKEMFDEIMKMIREKQIKLEAVVQRVIDQEMITHDSFHRIHKSLTEYGRKKQWL